MKHLIRNTLLTGIATIGFTIVIISNPQNVLAGEILYSTSGNTITSASPTFVGQSNLSSFFEGSYGDFSTLLSNGTYALPLDLTSFIGLYGDGTYFLCPYNGNFISCQYDNYLPFTVSGGNLATSTFPDETRIIDMLPENGTTTLSNTVDFRLDAFISEIDASRGIGVRIYLKNIDQNVLLLSDLSPSTIVLYDGYATTSGMFTYSTSTILGDGNYRLYAKLEGTAGDIWGVPLTSGCSAVGAFLTLVCTEGSTQFIVNEGTFIGNISQNSFNQVGTIFSSTTATSTAALSNMCNPFSGSVSTLFYNTNFNVLSCTAFLLIPDSGYLFDSLSNFRDNVSTHFPLGYITDLISIMSTTSSSSLPVISATIPTGIVGGGSTINLDPTHVLDFVLNSTGGTFTADSDTFYEKTSYYWNLILYILAGFYIFRRILGRSVIPFIHKKS